ncbi:MAG: hypothetical protein SOZ27_07775 [Spirochaetia bacterium]|nr:hypothetical protein [Spirochaetia bacterium]
MRIFLKIFRACRPHCVRRASSGPARLRRAHGASLVPGRSPHACADKSSAPRPAAGRGG